MKSRLVLVLSLVLSVGCSHIGTKAPLTKEGPGFDNLEAIQHKIATERMLDQELIEQTELLFKKENNRLGLAELDYLKGAYHFLVMKADNTDAENLSKAEDYLQSAEKTFGKLGEPILAAKSTYVLALANSRASKYLRVCELYHKTVDYLGSEKGLFREFEYDYDKEAFKTPTEYVTTVYEEHCQIIKNMTKASQKG